jgi:hypothetical protein
MDPSQTVNAQEVIKNYMLFFLLPMWVIPGILDYLCHRWSSIETTTGVKEACIHLLFCAQIGTTVIMGLWLEINSLVIVLMIVIWFFHELTTIWDVAYATTLRRVTTMEQHVHDYLVVVPLMAVSFVVCLKWNQFLAIFGAGPERADWTFALKKIPLPTGYLAFILVLFTFCTVIPYLEELWRCWRVAKERRAKAALATEKV